MRYERMIDKLDSYLNQKNFTAAEKLLDFWLEEAQKAGDTGGKLAILNEKIGLFRKIGKEQECVQAISEAVNLVEVMGAEGSVVHGTTLVNAATGYKAFGRAGAALPLYEQAKGIYEAELDLTDGRLGSLYNNMALALMDLGRYREAEEMYRKAIGIMREHPNGELEMAITYLNLADLVTAEYGPEDGEEQVEAYLSLAEELLNTEDVPRNNYYAFVCEKCAPVFGYYGYFFFEKELKERVREINERS